jgi:hypothetical protein
MADLLFGLVVDLESCRHLGLPRVESSVVMWPQLPAALVKGSVSSPYTTKVTNAEQIRKHRCGT